MSILAGNLKSLISVKIKPRNDDYTDQASRIFVTKIFVVSGLILGVDWFNDHINCMIPHTSHLERKYAESACWIKGFYVFPQMAEYMNHSMAYGIPQYAEVNGIWKGSNGHLCKKHDKHYQLNKMCIPMKKFYFTHYQWMPFVVAGFSVFFYLPYVLFRIINTEMISLCNMLAEPKIDVNEVIHTYFDHSVNSVKKMKLRIFFNILIKILYITVNIIVFLFFDSLLGYGYIQYGIEWIKWSQLDDPSKLEYSEALTPKPGDKLFPAFAFCDIQELSLDGTTAYENRVKLLCELSSNVLYQYVMLLIWFVLVLSTFIASCGFIINVGSHLLMMTHFLQTDVSTKLVYKYLTLRECEYCEKIRRANLHLYGKVVRKLLIIKGEQDENQPILVGNHVSERLNNNNLQVNDIVSNNIELTSNPFEALKSPKQQKPKKERSVFSKR